MRLDQFIFEKFSLKSRSYASSLIMAGKVRLETKVLDKAGYQVKEKDKEHITLLKDDHYVGWGAYKLLKAFESFQLNLQDVVALDIGSSTGGFTQILLEKGAKMVYAVDVGENQLDYSLRTDSRVISLEKTNARTLDVSFFEKGMPTFFVVDVSFISLKLIFPTLERLNLLEGVVLIKPQFEVGRDIDNFDGIIKNEEGWTLAQEKVISYAQECHFKVEEIVESPAQSLKKNKEFLAFIKRD